MQISARYQAVYELLTEIFKNLRPADSLINEYMRARKYIGSKDRRFITDTVWQIIRRRMRLEFETGSSDVRKILLLYLKDEDFDIVADGSAYGLKALSREEKNWLNQLSQPVFSDYVEDECPLWLYEKIKNPALVRNLNTTAPVDLRVNMAERDGVRARLKQEGLFFSLTPYSPWGLRSEERVNLNNCAVYQEGLVDVQDEASQTAAWLADVRPEHKTIDYCAGAGGKSLAMAAFNHNDGLIEAHDSDWNRMDVIKDRAERLGIRNIKLVKTAQGFDYDRFILDAPCSGSGTWRRSPDAKFRLTESRLAALVKTQRELLETAVKHTKSGGKIVYMTCSVLADENENLVENFVADCPQVKFVDHEQLWKRRLDQPFLSAEKRFIKFLPLMTNTDGFFFCMLEKM